ncbi:acylneuraminate cytidylyltransferase family protein [Candidatus Nomurabacteria bacterium]|nr:acylneuraminate cytidylyltransferase family protein [Candidatus Nomurabacteria bacterium]
MLNNKKEKVIAIALARGGSKSIPRKNVLPLHGKPLVAWPIDLAKSIDRIDRVVMTTDDDEIAEIAKKHGAEVPFKRPMELCDDETTTLPVIRHCIEYLENEEGYRPDVVLILYPTNPFLKKERVEQALDLFENTKCDSVLSVVKDWGRFWRNEEGGNYLPLHPKERVNRQYYEPLYREDGAMYFSRRNVLMDQNLLVSEDNTEFVVMEEGEHIDIDEIADWKKAEEKEI